MTNKGKKGKNSSNTVKVHGKRILEYKGPMEEYCKVSRALGDKRVMVVTVDGKEFIAHIPGKFKKKVWVGVNSVVIASRREFQNDKMDIIHVYENDEVKKLVKAGELPDSFLQSGVEQIKTTENKEEEEGGFDIDFDSEAEEEKPKAKPVAKNFSVVTHENGLAEVKIDCGFDIDDI
jgi:translation initiation factor 1A